MSDTLFYSPEISLNSQLSEIESHHCVKVLRMRTGDLLTVTDGKGSFYQCTIVDANPKRCIVSINNKIKVDKPRDFILQIAFAPTKQMDRNEWFVEKATEVGIDRFTPIISTYSERKEVKVERLIKTAISAMKQSQQPFLPLIDKTVAFKDFIQLPFDGKKLIAHCYETPKMALSQIYKKGENALILIGPEGDFSEEEVENAIAYGFEPISLGESRLRTETASLIAAHTVHVLNAL